MTALFHLVFGWFGIATLIGVAAVIVAVCSVWIAAVTPAPLAFLTTNLRHCAIIVAVAAFSFATISGKYYNEGLKVKQAEWDDAKAAALKAGGDAHSDAERSVDGGVRDTRDTDR